MITLKVSGLKHPEYVQPNYSKKIQLSAHVDFIVPFEFTCITENIAKKWFRYELRSSDEQIMVTLNYVLQNKIAQFCYKS